MPKADYDKLREKYGPDAQFVSASQIKTFRSCNRLWAFQYIDRIRPPDKPAAIRGKQMHAYLEGYANSDGELVIPQDTLPGLMAIDILPFIHDLPREYDDLTVEEFMVFEVAPNVYLTGYIDLLMHVDATRTIVIDYKSTSSFKWALSGTSLRTDVQALTYATYVARKRGISKIDMHWYYCEAIKGSLVPTGTRKVTTVVDTNSDLYKQHWAEVCTDIAAIVEMRKLKDSSEAPKNLKQCWAYNGCFFRPTCNKDLFDKHTTEDELLNINDLMASLGTSKKQTPAAEAPVEKTPSPPEPKPVTVEPVMTETTITHAINPPMRELTVEEEAATAEIENIPLTDEVSLPDNFKLPENEIDKFKALKKSDLYMYVQRNIDPSVGPALKKADLLELVAANLASIEVHNIEPQAKAEDADDVEELASTYAGAGASVTAQDTSVAEVLKRNIEQAPKKANAINDLVVVYGHLILRNEVSEPVYYLDQILKPYTERIAIANGLPHWSMVDYAMGKGLLAAYCKDWLAENKPSGFLVCDPSTAETQAVREVLNTSAKYVIVGVHR